MPVTSCDLRQIARALSIHTGTACRRARREAWTYVEQPARGGRKRLYPLASLPADVQAALKETSPPSPHVAPRRLEACATAAAPCGQIIQAGSPSFPAASPDIHRGAGDLAGGGGLRLGMRMGQHLSSDHAREHHAELARTRMAALTRLLSLPPRHPGRGALAAAIGRELKISRQQVYRLEAKARRGGLEALIDKPRRDRGQARVLVSAAFERALTGWGLRAQVAPLAERLLQLVRGAWAGGAPSAKQCWLTATATLAHQLMEEGWPQDRVRVLATLTAPRRFVDSEKVYQIIAQSQRDAKAIYNQHHAAISRSREGLLPGDLVFGDISPLDIPVLRPDGSTAYARLIVWHDAASNWLHVNLYLCPKGEGVRREHVAASFADLCARSPIGLPKRLYLDNGAEYKWDDMLACWSELARLAGQRTHIDVAALLPAAGRLTRSIPFRPRGKLIEGQFGNFRHWLAWHPAWQGGNRMAKKSAAMGRSPAAQSFEEATSFVAGLLADYHATPQGKGTHLDGRSPQEFIDACLTGAQTQGRRWQPLRVDEEVLLLAFAEQAERVVRGGHVQFAGREWFADFLMPLHGRVIVRYPRVFGATEKFLFVFTPQGRFIGIATPEPRYGVLDVDGSREAGRRGKVLRLIKNELAGQVAVIDPAHTVGLRGRLMGVDATVESARASAETIALSDEAQKLLAARNALTAKTQRALAYAAQAAQHAKRWTDALPDDPEVVAARAWLGEE